MGDDSKGNHGPMGGLVDRRFGAEERSHVY